MIWYRKEMSFLRKSFLDPEKDMIMSYSRKERDRNKDIVNNNFYKLVSVFLGNETKEMTGENFIPLSE